MGLRLYLPKEISEYANLNELKLCDTSFVGDGQKESRADLLYEIEMDKEKKKALIYLLFEHKSSPDRKAKKKQKHFYSGKKKRHTLKSQVVKDCRKFMAKHKCQRKELKQIHFRVNEFSTRMSLTL
jgi:hypothetical protein